MRYKFQVISYKTVGKKHVIQQTEEELLKERDKVEEALKKEAKVKQTTERVREAKIYISSSYNNTIITLTDLAGQVLAWKSAGSVGFKGTKKATSFAASRVAEAIATIVKKLGIEKLQILVKGIGAGRESAVRSFVAQGLDIILIKDVTPIPHNGCRPRKVRRV